MQAPIDLVARMHKSMHTMLGHSSPSIPVITDAKHSTAQVAGVRSRAVSRPLSNAMAPTRDRRARSRQLSKPVGVAVPSSAATGHASVNCKHARREGTHSGALARATTVSRARDFFTIGELVSGTYKICRLLGRGGMGEVYEAHDHVLNRIVALKVGKPNSELGSLLPEARAMALLCGHGVPNVYSMGRHHEYEYCVMERVYGTTLSRQVRRRLPNAFSIAEVISVLEGAADALSRVHLAGMIHRDLKPSNIMLAPKKRVVLIDFGLFRTEGHPWDESEIWGSPRYIAPETITHTVRLGQEHLVDIYALGVIAFCMLVGCPPFNSKSVSRILAKQVEQRPPRLSYMRPDVPAELDRLVLDMLAKNPAERPLSAEDVVERLRTIEVPSPSAEGGS